MLPMNCFNVRKSLIATAIKKWNFEGGRMKKFIGVFLILVFPVGLFAENNDRDKRSFNCPRLDTLIEKSNAEVKSYQGFHVNVLMFDGRPRITINFQTVQGSNTDDANVSSRLIFLVNDGSSKEVGKKVDEELTEIGSLSGNDENSVKCFASKRSDSFENVIKYELFDAQKRVRLIQWRDQDTGFNYQTAMYTSDGKLLSFETWIKLKVNRPIEANGDVRKTTLSAKGFLLKYKGFETSNPDLLEDFFEELINESF